MGSSQNAVDGSNRVMLPSDWRVEGAPVEFIVLHVPSATTNKLLVCPPPVFKAFLAGLNAGTADKTAIPQLERDLTDQVRRVRLDSYGRLPIPSDFLSKAGIGKRVKLVGRFSKFELWPVNDDQPETKTVNPELAEKLSLL